MTPPYFVRLLPQRRAAFAALQKFARIEEIPTPLPREEWDGAYRVELVATTVDGRKFAVAYEWTDAQALLCLPRIGGPRHDCPAARWPAEITCPQRKIAR